MQENAKNALKNDLKRITADLRRVFIEIPSQHALCGPFHRQSQGNTMTRADDVPEPNREPDDRAAARPRIINAAELFQGGREVCLELAGVRYRLRITRRNKLILQK
jgi:hemin uptake protein HemP